ncbi:MAG: 1-deoxy-D-xylulose-5-phosphate reductoisomerase [Clostridia bacterium]|nr:1-deoxy-D-xylulose-5-phosphate reductoisomerase [Clostridia bacterium]
MRSIAVLGATGSIGTQTMDIIRRYPERFRAAALSARSDAEGLFRLAREFKPDACALIEKPEFIPEDLRSIQWFFGETSSEDAIMYTKPDDALCAVVGIAGLKNVLAALDVCKRVLLANKEALVTGGKLVMEKAKRLNKEILPVDSEHSAIFQCLRRAMGNVPERIILTCSGGALRSFSKDEIENASVSDVLKHPTWKMGGKITVDCASLMNKGLEVIEAHHLFNMPAEKIDVIVHPQSIIHSMVEFSDGACLAQLGEPDMRGPIGYAMGDPERIDYGAKRLDFAKIGSLTFLEPDTERFPALSYAYEALKEGNSAPITLNGANEEAVGAFLRGEIRFVLIPRAVRYALDNAKTTVVSSVEDVFEADMKARALARRYLAGV